MFKTKYFFWPQNLRLKDLIRESKEEVDKIKKLFLKKP